MADELTIPKANPNMDAKGGFQFLNRPMESQYYESEYSIFGTPYNMPIGTAPGNFGPMGGGMMMPGMGMGMGMMMPGMGMYGNVDQYVDNMKKWNNGYHDIMDNNSDRSSETDMKNQSNKNIVNGISDSLTYDITRMQENIYNNDMRQACDNYDNLYKLIAKREGVEIEYHNGRIIKNEHINAQIAKCYKEVTGTDLMGDIAANGDGAIANGFKNALSFGDYQQGTAAEVKAYMTGDRLQDTGLRNTGKHLGFGLAAGGSIGAIAGGITGAVKGAKTGKAIGGAKGAAIGALIGTVVAWIGSAICRNVSSPDKTNLHKVTSY